MPPGPPDGVVSISDVFGVILAFQSAPGAPRKARADLEPNCSDILINITDALQALNGFNGLMYQFLPKTPDLCLSPCVNPLP